MGIQRGEHALYFDRFAAFTWIGQEARSAGNSFTLRFAAELREAVHSSNHPDDIVVNPEPDPRWAVVSDGRLVLWHGGKEDRP